MQKLKRPLVMIIDDSPENLKFIADIVKSSGYDYVMALNVAQVFNFIKKEKPDLILLDIMMPEIDGFTICRELKEKEDTKNIPIIFVSSKTEVAEIIRGFELGAVDYVTKPFNSVVLQARMNAHIQLKIANDELKEYIEKLKIANENSEYLANRDHLTGIYNRRYITERLYDEKHRYDRNKKTFSLGILDIDDFKEINDTYGHECGDFILISIVGTINEIIRKQDIFARWGGEEFILMLPETDINGAVILFEKIRKKINETVYNYKDIPIQIAITTGVAEFYFDESVDNCILRADQNLYKGKKDGKNSVIFE